VRQVARERQQLQLEGQAEPVVLGVRGALERPGKQLQEPAQALVGPWIRLGLGEQLQHRLRPDLADRQRVAVGPHLLLRADDVGARDGVQLAAALVQDQRGARQRLQPRSEARAGLAHALGDRVHAPPLERVQVQHAVGLREADRSQHHGVGLVASAHRRPV
jgi:hypothetical protein